MKSEMTTLKGTDYQGLFAGFVWIVVIVLIAFLLVIHLESVPPFSWDEGWTLSVARNWVERGIYGRLLMEHAHPPWLAASITVTTPVAFAFRLLGLGIWQGRMVGLVFFTGTVFLLYVLAGRIYDRSVAKITLAALFLTATIFPQLHPILNARQVLAEIPMLFFILGGYFCFYLVLCRSLWFMPLAVALWAAGAITKAQAPPFLAASFILPLGLTIWSRQWKQSSIIACGFASSFITAEVLLWLQKQMLAQYGWSRTQLSGMYSTVAFVPDLQIRWLAFQVSVFLLPTIFGLLYETRKSLNRDCWRKAKTDLDILRMAVLGFTVSWLIWYIFFSNAFPRYAFPANFVGSIFVGKLLRDLFDGRLKIFNWKQTYTAKTTKFLRGTVTVEVFLALLFSVVWPLSTLKMLYRAYLVEGDSSVQQVAQFVNTQTPSDSVVETYDSQVQFLLNRRYHFPSDQVHVDLIRRAIVGDKQIVKINYNPLEANADYLVVGDFIKGLRLYDPVIGAGAFRFLRSFNQYDVYERVR